MQCSEWSIVINNPCALAINVGSLLIDYNKYGQEFSLMSSIIVGSTSQLFAIVCNRVKSIALVLRQNTTNSYIGCISFNDKITLHISNQ